MLKISIIIRRGEYLVPGYLLRLSADLRGMPVTFFSLSTLKPVHRTLS